LVNKMECGGSMGGSRSVRETKGSMGSSGQDREQYVCVDIGGTSIKYGLVDGNGEILCRRERDTEASKGGRGILEKVLAIVEEFVRQGRADGVCISTAGMVDPDQGVITYAADLIPDYAGTNFKEAVRARFGLPCQVENDVNCAGLAEAVSGAGAGSSLVLMLTVGTGIGGSLILGGEIFRGFGGNACEVGYMYMDGSDFQSLGAASVLTRKVAERKHEPQQQWSGRRIFHEAKDGDEVCIQAIDQMVEVLGRGIANICYVVNPEVVVLGGGIMAQKEFLGERIRRAMDRYLVRQMADQTRLAFAKHGNDAGMLGAYYHFKNSRGYS
jgi:predicted NBD/HSP70 family sugar kinase